MKLMHVASKIVVNNIWKQEEKWTTNEEDDEIREWVWDDGNVWTLEFVGHWYVKIEIEIEIGWV